MNKTTQSLDAVEMKRRIQEQIAVETSGMDVDQLLDYFQKRIAGSRFADFLATPTTTTDTTEVKHGV